jgi:hypothetical protein
MARPLRSLADREAILAIGLAGAGFLSLEATLPAAGALAVRSKERKLRCPEDISLVSFDDHDWAPLFAPPLTVVSQPTYELGQMAARLLVKLIYHQEFESPAPLPVELVIRESCRMMHEAEPEAPRG